jgi:predicted nucleic acid-binding protein
MRAVVDASAFIDIITERLSRDLARGLAAAYEQGLLAPPLLWSEVTSALHRLAAEGILEASTARHHLEFLEHAAVVRREPSRLRARAWDIADRMGWVRTYHAEYCALAEIEDVALLTGDDRLVRGTRGRLPYVIRMADEARRLA